MAIIFITHDLGVIAEIADDVLVMYRGEEVEYGPVLDIFSNPKHPYTKGLLACRPRLETQIPPPAHGRRLHGNRRDTNVSIGDNAESSQKTRIADRTAASSKKMDRRLSTSNRRPRPAAASQEPNSPRSAIRGKKATTPPTRKPSPKARSRCSAVKNLKVYFPVRRGILARVVDHVRAVDGISFNVYRGQTLGLVGESRLRQNHHRPRDPAAHRADRRPACCIDGIDLRNARRRRAPRACAAKCKSSFKTPTARSTRG